VAFLKYSLLRIAFIVVCALGLYFAGARGALLWILAIIFGMLLSFLLLRKERDAVTSSFAGRKVERDAQFGKEAKQDAQYEDSLLEEGGPEARS